MPGVRCPLFSVTRLTANNLAARECVSSHCKARALPWPFSLIAFAIRICSLLTLCRMETQSSDFQSWLLAEDAPIEPLGLIVICFSSGKKILLILLQRETRSTWGYPLCS